MKRGKDNGFSEKGGPPGYVPLTLHQLGIGLTYYDEQRPPSRGRSNDSRRHDGNGRFEATPNGSAAGAEGAEGTENADGVMDEGLSQEAALDQMHNGNGHRSGGHHRHSDGGGNGRRNHHGGGGGGSRRSRHGGGGGGNGGGRRGGNGPMRGGIAHGGGKRRDDGADFNGNGADSGNSSQAHQSNTAPRGDGGRGEWSGGETEE